MRIYKRGEIYWIAFERDKKRFRYSLKTKKLAEAKEFLRIITAASAAKNFELAVKILRDLYGMEGDGKTPLADAWSIYLRTAKSIGKDKIAAESLADRKRALDNLISWLERTTSDIRALEDVSPRVAGKYAAVLAESGRAAKTRKNIIANLNAVWTILSKAVDNLTSPWSSLAPTQIDSVRRKAFSPEEEAKILEIARGFYNGLWYHISILARHTGLRYGDCATLSWQEVDLERGIIETVPNKTKRHNIKVVLPMVAELKAALAELPRKADNAYLFPAHAHACEINGHVKPLFSKILKEAGLDKKLYTFHSWRHTLRTRLAAAGVDTETAMRICGHTTQAMSRHYDHDLHLGELAAALEKAK